MDIVYVAMLPSRVCILYGRSPNLLENVVLLRNHVDKWDTTGSRSTVNLPESASCYVEREKERKRKFHPFAPYRTNSLAKNSHRVVELSVVTFIPPLSLIWSPHTQFTFVHTQLWSYRKVWHLRTLIETNTHKNCPETMNAASRLLMNGLRGTDVNVKKKLFNIQTPMHTEYVHIRCTHTHTPTRTVDFYNVLRCEGQNVLRNRQFLQVYAAPNATSAFATFRCCESCESHCQLTSHRRRRLRSTTFKPAHIFHNFGAPWQLHPVCIPLSLRTRCNEAEWRAITLVKT